MLERLSKGPYEESNSKATGRVVGAQALKSEKPGPALSPTEGLRKQPPRMGAHSWTLALGRHEDYEY